jgi:hypothetical protein
VQRRWFHDYWMQKATNGVALRVPILKARHHLGAMSSRGDRAENEDRFKVGLMNKLSETEEHQPFYFAIIDGFVPQVDVRLTMQTRRTNMRGLCSE